MALTLSGSTDTGYGVAGDTNGVRVNNNGTTVATFGTTGKSLALEGASAQTGTGITFPATQSASSNANTLDDYEEGTFTPTVSGVTLTIAAGKYTKIGRVVYVQIFCRFPSTADTTIVTIAGLPFAPVTTGNTYRGGMSVAAGPSTLARVPISDSGFLLAKSDNTVLTNADCSTADIEIGGWYST